MSSYFQTLSYFFRLPWHVQWRTFLVQLPRYVPLAVLHLTSPKGPHPFVIALPSRKNVAIPIYVFVPPKPVQLEQAEEKEPVKLGDWKVPVVLDFHGGGFIMGSPLEQAPYGAMMSRELGAVVISVSYRIGPFHQFPAAIHDAEDVLAAILDIDSVSRASKVLRIEIQRYYDMLRSDLENSGRSILHLENISTITLDPTRLSISGFSAGGNIALNLALSTPPYTTLTRSTPLTSPTTATTPSLAALISPRLPPKRVTTVLDDPTQPWPSLLPPTDPTRPLLPLLLFYPSLDARLLPHERPTKPLPNALNPHDTQPQQQRMPGLFSIMGPTYLPRRLRSHPRASPGLVDPENIARGAAIFLVLPERDSLAVQSDVWVDGMNEAGWNGPVRFGEGEGRGKVRGEGGGGKANGGLEVWHAPGCKHGWTQFPEPILVAHEKRERELVFARTLEFVRESWATRLPL